MLKYLLAILCGTAISGSVYMAGWRSEICPDSAQECCQMPMAFSSADGKIDVGNTKCIVMVEPISDRTVPYKGKLYHICCEECIETFKKDPEKYVKQLEADPAKYGVKK